MKKLEELRFVLTDEMNKMFVEIIIIKQRLKEKYHTKRTDGTRKRAQDFN